MRRGRPVRCQRSVPRSGGCNAFATMGRASQCRVAEVPRHWRSIHGGILAVSERRDLTLDEIVSVLDKRRIATSRSALSRFFARHGITFKKKPGERQSGSEPTARARRRWVREQGWLYTARLVFIDETAVTTNMVRLNGWNPRGERLFVDAPMAAER